MARQHLGEGALAAAVATHHGMDLTGTNGEIHPLEDRLMVHGGMEIANLKQYRGVGADHGSRGKGKLKSKVVGRVDGSLARR